MGLAAFGAASELIGRFRDRPFKVLIGGYGLTYLALNALLAGLVLAALRFASPPSDTLIALEQLLLAGLGARTLVRTKVVSGPVRNGQAEEIGPGAMFERLLDSISRGADRDRAAERLQLVQKVLHDISWSRARSMFLAELVGAMQDLTDEEKKTIEESVTVIDSQDLEEATRIHLLGYLILDYGGEEFLRELAEALRQKDSEEQERAFGMDEGKVVIHDDFDEPDPETSRLT